MTKKVKTNKVFMAFASGKESSEEGSIKRYIGIGSSFVVGVCPDKKELEALYGTTLEKDPEYVSVAEIGEDKVKVPQARIDFILKTDPEKNNGIEFSTKASFFLRQEYYFNKDKTKVQVIDKFGRTAWVTQAELRNKSIPQYANGPANISDDYRMAYVGESDLTDFIKAYLNIPNPMNYNRETRTWTNKSLEEQADCEARLDKIENYFKGDFKELSMIINLQPKNKVKVMFGVKTTEDNRQYQTVYTQMVLRNGVTDYKKLQADLVDRMNNGAFSTTEFSVEPLREYNINATSFEGGITSDDSSTDTASVPWETN